MTVTIIGSLSKAERMKLIKRFLETKGVDVNIPLEKEIQSLPIVQIQKKWIEKIKEADYIVAVPEDTTFDGNGSGEIKYLFGESTSYEMAIADEFHKPVFIAG